MQYLGAISKTERSCLVSTATIQYHSNPTICPNQWWQTRWSSLVLWRPIRLMELTPGKYMLYIIKNWDVKVGHQAISRIKGKVSLIIQNEAGQRLTEFSPENTLVITSTLFQQPKRRLFTWTPPDGQ